MRLPERMPLRSEHSERTPGDSNSDARTEKAEGLSPAACCAEACVNVPFVGRVCHCVLELPICP
jgi:hypothetical protein